MSDLTQPQRAMLELLDANRHPAFPAWTGDDLLRHLYDNHSSTQGVHQTAASLVRRGYLAKRKVRGQVVYNVTAKGHELVAALCSLDKARR